MEKYYRQVIDLLKDSITSKVSPERILEAKRDLMCAMTEQRILGNPDRELKVLLSDIENL